MTEPPPIPVVPGEPTPGQPTQPPQPAQPPEWRPERVAGNTVVVIVTILGIFIGLPLLCCLGWAILGVAGGALSR